MRSLPCSVSVLIHFLSASPVEKFELKRKMCVPVMCEIETQLNPPLCLYKKIWLDINRTNHTRRAWWECEHQKDDLFTSSPSSQITLTPGSSSLRPTGCTNNRCHVHPLAHRVAHTEQTRQNILPDLFTDQKPTHTQYIHAPPWYTKGPVLGPLKHKIHD